MLLEWIDRETQRTVRKSRLFAENDVSSFSSESPRNTDRIRRRSRVYIRNIVGRREEEHRTASGLNTSRSSTIVYSACDMPERPKCMTSVRDPQRRSAIASKSILLSTWSAPRRAVAENCNAIDAGRLGCTLTLAIAHPAVELMRRDGVVVVLAEKPVLMPRRVKRQAISRSGSVRKGGR